MTAALGRVLKLLLLIAAVAGVARPNSALAQPAGDDASRIAAEKGIATTPISIDGRVLFRVRGVTAFPAAERAAGIAARIRAVAADDTIPASDLRLVESDHSTDIVAGNTVIMEVFDADAIAEAPGLTRQPLARAYLAKISSAVQQYRAERTPEQLEHSALLAGVWTVLLVLALLLLAFGLRWMVTHIERRYHSAIEQIESGTFRLIHAGSIWIAVRLTVRLLTLIAALAIFYAYLHIVLNYFPWTRGVSAHLRALTVAPLLALAVEVAAGIPSLLVVFVIVVAARYVISLAHHFFSAIENGVIKVSAFEAEWAKPTFNIVRILIIAFAAMIAYPYIPGSQSAAFKGITIFIGVLFSLGSSSLLANVIAGYTMTYRRAFHVGDRIKAGDLTGDVTEVGLMVTHLRSVKNEELIVPNSLILNSNIVNYTSLARERGLVLHTAVGIGYETPWRQVEAMLLLAAERTPGLLREPAPFILQQSLGDYAVNYELNVYCDKPAEMYRLYTELHRCVLDVFNEYNVQIMTPSYIADPAEPKVVPKEHWFEKPAQAVAQPNRLKGVD
jgi:small-conductance mechanosensitive channel